MDNHTREQRLKAYQLACEKIKGLNKEAVSSTGNLKMGDLFYTSWGYDQTNYDYIVVLSVSATGKTVKCQRTSALHIGHSCQNNVQVPIFCPFGDVFTMYIRKGYKGDTCLKGSYPFCNNGKMDNTRLDSFSRVSKGQQFHETMVEFGH